jgi:hypothetical protein
MKDNNTKRVVKKAKVIEALIKEVKKDTVSSCSECCSQ